MDPATSTQQSDCPDTQALVSWLDGNDDLTPHQLDHLQNCPLCAEKLMELTEDEALRGLASDLANGDYSEEPEFARLRANLGETPPPKPTETLPTIQAEVETDHESSGQALPASEIAQLQDLLPDERYKIDRQLAAGGSGKVFLAFDTRLNCRVAVKVLARDSFRDRHRFAREARILADIAHQNVVRIFDFGLLGESQSRDTKAGDSLSVVSAGTQHYLVMEYLAGGTLVDLVSAPDQPAALDYRTLARLLSQACQGVGAAHEKGLIHRDVKPNNILLNEEHSEAKVIDFGLARVEERDTSLMTREGSMLGTPAFMSPEQVSETETLTQATDVYSLGATLYFMLTGQPPFQGHPATIVRQVADSSPPPPSVLNPSIPLDLTTICLRAMEREPAQRYSSAQAFADDLLRFAENQPIHARPVSSLGHAWRFLRRNPAFGSTILACVLLVALLLVGTTSAAIVLNRKNEDLSNAMEGERRAKEDALVALQESVSAADELLLSVTTETEFLPRTPGSQDVSRALLNKARDYFKKFLSTHQDSSDLKYHLARAHAGLATVATRTGDLEQAEQETWLAIELIDSIPSDQISEIEKTQLKADTLITFANFLIESGEAKEAIPLFSMAITAWDAVSDTPDSIRPSALASQGLAALGSANAYSYIGDTEQTEKQLASARQILEGLVVRPEAQPSDIRNLATTYMIEATLCIDRNESLGGIKALEQAQELLAQIDPKEGISLRVREMRVKNLTNMALAQKRLGNHQLAKELYADTIDEAQRLIELEPGVPAHQWDLVVAVLNSGGPDLALGNLQELVDRWRDVEPVLESLQAAEPDNSRYRQVHAMLNSNIAIVLRDMGKQEEAIAPLESATAILLEHAKQMEYAAEPYFAVALNHYELASTYVALEEIEQALEQLAQSDSIAQQILNKQPDFVAAASQLIDNRFVQHELFKAQDGLGPAAKDNASQALQLATQLAESNQDEAKFALDLAKAWIQQGEVQLALQELDDAFQSASRGRELAESLAESAESDVGIELVKKSMRIYLEVVFAIRTDAPNALSDVDYPALRKQAIALGMAASELPPATP